MASPEDSLFDRCVGHMEEKAIQAIMNAGRVAGYDAIDDAIRYHSQDPIYSAVWMIAGAAEKERDYSPPHTHNFPELNILAAAPGDLVYRILIGEEEREVESPATILIPPGVPHAANIVRGAGAFVVVRLVPEQLELSDSLRQE